MKKITHVLPLAALLATVIGARGANIRDGLVAYRPLDDATGNVAADVAFTVLSDLVGWLVW